MKHHLNTLFVTTQGAYLRKERETLHVVVDKKTALHVPLHHLGGIVCFGRVSVSPFLLGKCGELGIAVTFLTEHGRFLARATGFTPGNVLLRREQYRRADDDSASAYIARNCVAAKIANSRNVLLRAARDYPDTTGSSALSTAAAHLAQSADSAIRSTDLDTLRGIEGDAANTYFSAFSHLITVDDEAFIFTTRNRRPPLDPVNALLSFLYAMLTHDARAACEAAGLDPQVGFLHRDRPGRPSLALDLMEEFRAYLADRLALSLINRRQVTASGFTHAPNGAVTMSDSTRKTLLSAYQKRKQQTIEHPYLKEKTTIGLLIHLQARLLARHLRGDIDAYPAFLWK